MQRVISIAMLGLVLLLGPSGASHAEDGLDFAVNCGGGCGLGTQTASDKLLAAIPGGVFVITVAHLAPSPEDAFVRGKAVECRPAEFRVDMLQIGARDGAVAVEVGEKQMLAPGKSARIVHGVSPNSTNAGADMDQLAFRIRAARVSPRCDVVASGMFYESAASMQPIPFSLLVDDGVKHRLGR